MTRSEPSAEVSVAPTYEDEVFKALWGSPAGKRLMAKQIVSLLPESDTYIEPFAGSAAVLFAREPVATEAINDLNPEIAFSFEFVKALTDGKLKRLQRMNWVGTRATFAKVKAMKPKNEIERFYRARYLSYAGFFRQDKSFDPSKEGKRATLPDRLLKGQKRLANVEVRNGDYEEIIKEFDGPDAVMFLDPPYIGYKQGVGEEDFDGERFIKVLRAIKGKFLVTWGGSEESTRKLFKGFQIRSVVVNSGMPTGGVSRKTFYYIANYSLPQKIGKATYGVSLILEKGSLDTVQNCRYGDHVATKAVIWCEGRAYLPVCDDHVERAKAHLKHHGSPFGGGYGEPDAIRNLPTKAGQDTSAPGYGPKPTRKAEEYDWKSTATTEPGGLEVDADTLFANEHAARQEEPDEFESFRRLHTEGMPEGIDMIAGIREDGSTSVQSIRFDRDQWTPEAAREWLGEHKFSADDFEEAAEKATIEGNVLLDPMIEYSEGDRGAGTIQTHEALAKFQLDHVEAGWAANVLSDGDLDRLSAVTGADMRAAYKAAREGDVAPIVAALGGAQLGDLGSELLARALPVTVHTDLRLRRDGDDQWQGGEIASGNSFQPNALALMQPSAGREGIEFEAKVDFASPAGGVAKGDPAWMDIDRAVYEPGAPGATADLYARFTKRGDFTWVAGAQEARRKEFWFAGSGMNGLWVFESKDDGSWSIKRPANQQSTSKTLEQPVITRKSIYCPIVKVTPGKRLVTGIALTPETVDVQGDIISEEVIAAAAHEFVANYNDKTRLGVQHKDFSRRLDLVESWMVREDTVIDGRKIKKGTWMVTIKVVDDGVWALILSGKLRGFSIGGMAKVRRDVDAAGQLSTKAAA